MLLTLFLGIAAVALAVAAAARAPQRRAPAGAAATPPLEVVAMETSNLVIITDRERRITWVNPAFERVSGYRLAEALGQSPGRLLQCEHTDPATVLRMRERLDAGLGFSGEVLNRARDGRLYWLDIRIEPLQGDAGTPSGFVSIQSDITERKRAEEALRASQSFLEHTGRIGSIGGWSYEPATGRMNWTAQVWQLLGRKPAAQPTLADCLQHLGPQSRSDVLALVAAGPGEGERWDIDLQALRGDGRECWLRVVAERERQADGGMRFVGTVQDVTERRAAKATALRNATLLRGAIDAIDEAFVLYDPEDRLVMCNEKYRALYSRSADLLVPGARFEDILRVGAERGQYPAAVGRVDEWVALRLQQHRAGGTPVVQRLDDGRVLRIVERVMSDGHVVGFRVDITDLVRATEAAEQADRVKGEFIATVSHELRTPLQSILGFSDLGRHFAAGHPQFETMFNDIHAGGSRMLRLVNGLLDISKIDGTLGSLALKRADLAALAAAVAGELRIQAAERQLALKLPQPLPVLAADLDAFRMQQVLRNVMANAIRFAPEGSAVDIDALDRGTEGVQVVVSDRGPGIPQDELDAIFQPFVQSTRTRSGAGGTGLGLAICRRIMGAHGGSIVAVNRAGGGASFSIELPAPAAEAPATGAPVPPEPVAEPPRPRKTLRDVRRPAGTLTA